MTSMSSMFETRSPETRTKSERIRDCESMSLRASPTDGQSSEIITWSFTGEVGFIHRDDWR